MRHNNVIPNAHFHKTLWQDHVKTWFDQAARKKRRRTARMTKAAACAPRPVGLLRPAVHPPTVKYNYKLRQGRGFTFAELKEAGIKKKEARGIGIAVDHRRRNRSAESLQLNSQRLKEYKAALILFPKKKGKPKAGDSSKEECGSAQQSLAKTVMPLPKVHAGEEAMTITAEMKSDNVFHKIRIARADYRLFGIRQRNQCAARPPTRRSAAPREHDCTAGARQGHGRGAWAAAACRACCGSPASCGSCTSRSRRVRCVHQPMPNAARAPALSPQAAGEDQGVDCSCPTAASAFFQLLRCTAAAPPPLLAPVWDDTTTCAATIRCARSPLRSFDWQFRSCPCAREASAAAAAVRNSFSCHPHTHTHIPSHTHTHDTHRGSALILVVYHIR